MGFEGGSGSRLRALADPQAELPVKNYKYVKGCTELYLAQRGIEEVANFEGFANLEVLWLNRNRIAKLEGLDNCFRIKELYAQSNRILTLEGSSLANFKFLHKLRLNDNKLDDFPTTLRELARIHHLEDLDLYGNPLAEEENYRLHVICAVPTLLVLDRHVVTDDERAKAVRLRDKPRTSVGERQSKSKRGAVVAGAPPQAVSKTVNLLFREAGRIQREIEAEKRAEEERELRVMDQQRRELWAHGGEGVVRTSGAASTTGLPDAWEFAALEKYFRTLEDKPKAGITIQGLSHVLAYLADRGFQVTCGAKLLTGEGEIDGFAEHLRTIFPHPRISWQQLKHALEKNQLVCTAIPVRQLMARAERNYADAAAIQKRLSASRRDEEIANLAKEAHQVVQRAYHLSALADEKSTHKGDQDGRPDCAKSSLSPLRTRYYAVAFARAETGTARFAELREQATHLDGGLGQKYKLHQKDFQKYMIKEAPPATAFVRRQFNL